MYLYREWIGFPSQDGRGILEGVIYVAHQSCQRHTQCETTAALVSPSKSTQPNPVSCLVNNRSELMMDGALEMHNFI